jgi:hypothetical protein
MNTEYFSFDDGANAKIVKHFGAVFPRVGITVLSDSFIIETVYSSNLSSLVVSSQQCNVSRVLELEAEE